MEHQDTFPIEGGFVVMPRYILKHNREGLISNPERNLLVYLRQNADLVGVSVCTMQGIADEAFNSKVEACYINKLLRSLKRKRYLWYRDRNGRRGSFEIHFPDLFLKNGKIKKIDHFYLDESVKAPTEFVSEVKQQPQPILEEESQRILERKEQIRAMLSRITRG